MNGWKNAFMQNVKRLIPQVAMYLMLATVLGFIFFYDLLPYFCVPAASDMPVLAVVAAVSALGFLAGYLYPDIQHVLFNATVLPLLGALACAGMSVSPALSPDIVSYGISEGLLALAMLLLPYILISFLAFFITGFMSMYLFEEQRL